jgi:hypothetical protein
MANYNLFDAASLAMVPVGYKANKLYSVKPDTGAGDFDFSRASYATRVNADGLIEKERGNLLLQSNTFNTTWTAYAISSITNGESGYDGSSDAWLLNAGAAGGNIAQSLSVSGVHTFSIYAKKGTANGIRIRFDQTTDTNVYVDLRDGSVGTAINDITSITEDVGGGWYRVKFSMLNAGLGLMKIYPTDGGTNAADGSIYIQDAQLEQGLVATEYIETTTAPIYKGVTDNIPRIDYTSGCGSLLLEPSRSNIIESSEYLGHSSWVYTRITSSANEAISPEGVKNATLIANTTDNGNHTTTNTLGAYTNASLAVSFYAKKKDNDYLQFGIYNSPTKWAAQKINLATGAILGSGNAGFHNAPSSVSVTPVGNDWYRVEALFTTSLTGATEQFYLAPTPTDTNPTGSFGLYGGWTGATTENAYIYGVQVEQGSYPTSYIPTYGSSVTRLLDNPYILSQSSLIGQTEGTVYAELKSAVTTPLGSFFISISDGTSNNRVLIGYAAAANSFRVVVIFSGVSNGGNNYSITDSTEFLKVAVKYTESSVDVFINGVKQISQSGGSFSGTLNKITFDNGTGANKFEGSIKQRFNFTTALTDNELAALTRPYDTYQEWVDGEGLTWESKTCTTQSILELQNL